MQSKLLKSIGKYLHSIRNTFDMSSSEGFI